MCCGVLLSHFWSIIMHPMCCRERISNWRQLVYPVQCWDVLRFREHMHHMLCRVLHSNFWRISMHPMCSRVLLRNFRCIVMHPMLCREQLSNWS
jgi:hypothetical protein